MIDENSDHADGAPKQDHTGRTIAVSLLVSGVLAVGFFFYLSRSMPKPEPPLLVPEATRRPEPNPLLGVSLIATAFVENLAASRFADAYQLMAGPYRDAVSLAGFEKSCRASKFLTGAKSVRIRRMIEVAVPVDGGLLHSATARAPVTFITDQGLVSGELVFLREPDHERILNLSIEGVLVLQGITAKTP